MRFAEFQASAVGMGWPASGYRGAAKLRRSQARIGIPQRRESAGGCPRLGPQCTMKKDVMVNGQSLKSLRLAYSGTLADFCIGVAFRSSRQPQYLTLGIDVFGTVALAEVGRIKEVIHGPVLALENQL